MMRSIRFIPRLDIKGPNLVKGVHLEGLRVLGRPEDFAFEYYHDGADELFYMDVVASLYGRNSLLDIVQRTAEKIFIPLTVGGGIRSVEDIRKALRSGADKVALNTAAIRNPELIRDGARTFGSQCIVVSIEAKRHINGLYEAMTDNGRQETGVDVFEWARKACDLGAGEIFIMSVDRDGTGEGYDIELVSRISESVSVPVVACGGAGRPEHVEELIRRTNVSAVSCASMFHYSHIKKDAAKNEYEEGNIEYLKKVAEGAQNGFSKINPISVHELKLHLHDKRLAQTRMVPRDNYEPYLKNDGTKGHKITVVDYGCGNLFSIRHALQAIGADFEITSDPQVVAKAESLLMPGVGSFDEGMKNLGRLGLIDTIKDVARSGRPILGICLGMQLFMDSGGEFEACDGLGLIEGSVDRLKVAPDSKIPHIGWNNIICRGQWQGTILDDVSPGSLMYFVHSYVVAPADNPCVLAVTEYGGAEFCSVVKKGNICGCQFHPERSGQIGLDIYRQFVFGTKGVVTWNRT